MNKLVVWLIYLSFWWNNKHEKVRDDVLRRAARRYWFRVDWLIKFGLFATFAFFTLLALFASGETCGIFACENRFRAFLKAPANEVGDTLAGIAGGLAFLWLVVTVLLQGKELAAQREELRLTRQEMSEQRKATQDMARAMEAQADIFLLERKAKQEELQDKLCDELLHNLLATKSQLAVDSLKWRLKGPEYTDFGQENVVQLAVLGRIHGVLEDDLAVLYKAVAEGKNNIEKRLSLGDIARRNSKPPIELDFIDCLDRLLELSDHCSAAQQAKLERTRIFKLSETLDDLFANKQLWDQAISQQ